MKLRQHIVMLVAVLLALPYTDDICCGAESVKVDGVRIAFSSEGSGDPVVLIHGLHSSTELNWRNPGIIKMLSLFFVEIFEGQNAKNRYFVSAVSRLLISHSFETNFMLIVRYHDSSFSFFMHMLSF